MFKSETGKLSYQEILRLAYFGEDREDFVGLGTGLHHPWSKACIL